MILEREDEILTAIVASRALLNDNILRAIYVLKQNGWILVTKFDGSQTIIRDLRANWGESSEEEARTYQDREGRRNRQGSSEEDERRDDF